MITNEQLMNSLFDCAATMYARGEKEVLPMCHAVTEDGQNMLICLEWANPDEKTLSLAMLRQVFREKRVIRYGILAEAWAALYQLGVDPHWTECMPAQRNNRIEIIAVCVADRDGYKKSIEREILRDETGRPSLGKAPYSEPGIFTQEGRMLELLDDD